LSSRSTLKPCLRSPFKAPKPDLPQALQRTEIAAALKARVAPEAAKFDEIVSITRERALTMLTP
jgi:hypothetical protein